MNEVSSYVSQFEKMRKSFHDHVFRVEKETVPHSLPQDRIQPVMKKAIEQGDANKATFIALSQSSVIRGGLVGAILTSLIGFNAGKYSRLGAVRKRLRFVRNFIVSSPPLPLPLYTNYFYPNHKTVTTNFKCFSGESGIGKSYHFQQMSYLQSLVRPSLYLSFKASGQGNTFEQDMAIKLDYGGGQNPPMFSQIMSAVRTIHRLNTNPLTFWLRTIGIHALFIWTGQSIIQSQMLDQNQGLILGMLATAYGYYFYMVYPYIMQSFRKTKPLIIFDDVGKIHNIGQLAQISRYLQLLDQNMANIILVSSDQQIWFKLRKQPGLKDRLRQKIITYDHKYTAQQMLKYIENQANYQHFLKKARVSPLYTKQFIQQLIKQLIGNRQVTIRRLANLLVLNDQQQYQRFVKVLVFYREKKKTLELAINRFTQILYDSEKQIACAEIKHIRRQLNISEEQFIKQMKMLLEKGKLTSQNKIAPHLNTYSIVRDTQSEYVFNGKFMYTVFQMAYQEYINDMKAYHQQSPVLSVDNSNIASRQVQKTPLEAKITKQLVTEVLSKAKIYEGQKK